MTIPFSSAALPHLHASFLAIVLPRVLSHGRVCFGGIKCPHRREDAIQDMIGLAWKWHLRLAEKGKDATVFPTALASYAASAVKSGSRVAGLERANDVLSPVAQRRHHFYLGRLPDFETLTEHLLCEALVDNTKSPPDETVCFKLDFLAWLASLTERDRRIVEDLMIGERTLDVANKYQISPARISQKRREFCRDWCAFLGDDVSTSMQNRSGIA